MAHLDKQDQRIADIFGTEDVPDVTDETLEIYLTSPCLAYIWIVYLGAICVQQGWVKMIHRTDRCDLSLFQLGLRLLDYILNEGLPIPVALHIETEESKRVR